MSSSVYKRQSILLGTTVICAVFALISITWAAFSSTLTISGQATVEAAKWDIDFTNTVGTKWTAKQSLTGAKENLAELPASSDTSAFSLPVDQEASGFLGTLKMSGDKITYTWYVQNFGEFNANYYINGVIATSTYTSGSNVDITCNTSDNSKDKTFCNNYVKTLLTIDGTTVTPSQSFTLNKAGSDGDHATVVLTIEITGENQIYTGTLANMNQNTNRVQMLSNNLTKLSNSNGDLDISVKSLSITSSQEITTTTTTTEDPCISQINSTKEFDYTGEIVEYKIECPGTYKLEVWGAQGYTPNSTYIGGYGAYAVGSYKAEKGTSLYVTVGQEGIGGLLTGYTNFSNGGMGGSGDKLSLAGSGGGSTHIMTVNGLLESQSSNLNSILIVAAGGGSGTWTDGNSWSGYGGHAGGYVGNSATAGVGTFAPGKGATQTAGGAAGNGCYAGTFGKGSVSATCCAAGGGGFYGGGGSWGSGGGGGSSYIGNSLLSDKAMYCYNCTESSSENTKTISTTNVSSTATTNYAKSGNGYAKITYVSYGN